MTEPATAVREKPIIFSGAMVRAILSGAKTQTRRVVKPTIGPDAYWSKWEGECWRASGIIGDIPIPWRSKILYSPHGDAGDRLWVREAWQAYEPQTRRFGGNSSLAGAQMRAYARPPIKGESIIEYRADRPGSACGWRSSLHMPRWASRLTLRITAIRVERLSDISNDDARAEGVDAIPDAPAALSHRTAFAGLWDKINGKTFPWAANPWVWCVSFERVTNDQ